MSRSTMPSWWDIWQANWTMALRLSETMIAADAVIASRLPMINSAIRDPLAGNQIEMTRMVTEKADAFGRAGASVARDMQAIGADMVAATNALGLLSTAGLFGGQHLLNLSASTARAMNRVLQAPGRALAPVHSRATANARRLDRRRG